MRNSFIKNPSSLSRLSLVTVFCTVYVLTRSSFIPLINAINFPGFASTGIFSGNNLALIFAFIYAIVQIPYGSMIDRLGIRKGIILLSGLMTGGFLICALAPNAAVFALGRIITAFGCAGAFICSLKTAAQEAGQENMGRVAGFINGIGLSICMLFTQLAVPLFVENTINWRIFFFIKTGLVFLVMLFFIFSKEKTQIEEHSSEEKIGLKQFFKEVVKNKFLIKVLLFSLIFFMVFYGLLETTYIGSFYESLGVSANKAYSILLCGFLLGFFTIPSIANYFGQMRTIFFFIVSLLTLSFIMFIKPSIMLANALAFLAGYSNGLQLTMTEIASYCVDKRFLGITGGLMNTLFVGGVVIAQTILTNLIPRSIYGTKTLFLFTTIVSLIALIIFLFMRGKIQEIMQNNSLKI